MRFRCCHGYDSHQLMGIFSFIIILQDLGPLSYMWWVINFEVVMRYMTVGICYTCSQGWDEGAAVLPSPA